MVSSYMIHAACIWILVRNEWRRRQKLVETIAFYSCIGRWILRMRVTVHGEAPGNFQGRFLVGNHLSYMDVLTVSSICPSSFVTSKEVQQTPLLGQICRLAGCVFVDRKNRFNLMGEIGEIVEGLTNKLNVLVFAEATSTNGEKVLRFRRPLFAAAAATGAPIIPFCINYRTINGEKVGPANRDIICWYGDMDFLPHIWKLASQNEVCVDLHFLPAMKIGPEDDLTQAAAAAQARVESVFISLGEKPGHSS